jgi:hypothetical protein
MGSDMPNISSVPSDDYMRIILLAGPEHRDNCSIRRILLLVLARWSNLPHLPLAICFGKMSIITVQFFPLVSFDTIWGGIARDRLYSAPTLRVSLSVDVCTVPYHISHCRRLRRNRRLTLCDEDMIPQWSWWWGWRINTRVMIKLLLFIPAGVMKDAIFIVHDDILV